MTKQYVVATKRDLRGTVPVPTEIIANIPGIDIIARIGQRPNIIIVESDDSIDELRAKLGDAYYVETNMDFKTI
jgi:hypothetical protein